MRHVSLEMIFDAPKGSEAPRPSFAPRSLMEGKSPETAQDWGRIYGAMVSYESAIDAAGYDTEAQMMAPDAPRKVLMVSIDDQGEVNGSWRGREFTLTSKDIFDRFGLQLPVGAPGRLPNLVWMGGPREAVLQDAYSFGPFPDTEPGIAYAEIGDIAVGKNRQGEVIAVKERIEGGFVDVDGGLEALRNRDDSPSP